VPTYDYQCRACGNVTEVIHSMLDDGPSVCEICGGTLRRVIYPSGIIFKGSGFYRNDSRASASSSKAGSDKGSGGSDKGDSTGTDASAGSAKAGESSSGTTAPTEPSST
jgi:putative FmdB family regulatory protein